MVERRRERDDSAHRDEPARRLDRRRPALRRGDAQRAGRVGAGRRGHLPGRERRRRAAARAARRPLERPRVADLVGRPAAGELVRVQVAEQHHALGGEPRPDVAVALGHLVEHAARGGQRLAGDGVEILQPDRDPAERRARRPRRAARRRVRRRRERVLLVDAHPGVDRVGIAVVAVRAVPLADPREAGLDELARGERRGRRGPRPHRSRRGRPGSRRVVYTAGGQARPRRDVRPLPPARADDDVRQPGLDRGPVPDRPARRPALRPRPARGHRGRDGERLRDRPGRAGARPAAHDGRARHGRERRSRPRASTARRWSSSSASRTGGTSPTSRSWPGGWTGLAGEYPVSVEQPGRRPGRAGRDRARLPRGGDAPGTRARDRADGRLARARRRGARARRRRRPGAARGRQPTRRRSTRSPPSSPPPSAPALVVGAGADDPETWAALVELAERLRRARLPGGLRRPGRLPAGSPAYQGVLLRRPRRGFASRSPPTTRCSSSARRPSGRPVSSRGASPSPGTRIAVVGDDPDEVHRSPAELSRARPDRARDPELAAAVPPARDAAARAARGPGHPGPARAGRAADREPCARRAGRAPAAERGRRSRRRRSTGRTSTNASRPASRSAT